MSPFYLKTNTGDLHTSLANKTDFFLQSQQDEGAKIGSQFFFQPDALFSSSEAAPEIPPENTLTHIRTLLDTRLLP